jgi:outer membrane protein OmpA-like peptidoglycan-associated protein
MITMFYKLLVFMTLWPLSTYDKCQNHPLFNQLPHHKVVDCTETEFEQLIIHVQDEKADFGYRQEKKQGAYLETWYEWTGDWEKRPSAKLIFENYKNAVLAKGGAVLYESKGSVHLNLRNHWIVVTTDHSGQYAVKLLTEQGMNQYIEVSAESIARDIEQSGKSLFHGILFDFDRATIKSESMDILAEIAKYLKANPGKRFFLVGHTDNVGAYEHNMKLSLMRAEAVADHLVAQHQITADRLKAVGVGPLSPIDTNQTDAGRQWNRRVELVQQ